MKRRKIYSYAMVQKYSMMVEDAMALGVPLSDILSETDRHHGRDFTSRVLDELSLKAS